MTSDEAMTKTKVADITEIYKHAIDTFLFQLI